MFSLSKEHVKSRIFNKLCLVRPITLFIVFAFVLIILGNAILLISSNNNYFGTTGNYAYGQQQLPKNQMNSNNITNSLDIQSIPAKKVHVGDIEIAYKTFGKGDPFLLISPSSSVMDAWDPSILRELSSNHTLIIFDNRGVGNTTTGSKPFSIQQLANDTAGLLDALKIRKVDVLGYSLGSFVAQQLAVTHPEKVNRLILLGASCGGKEGIPQNPQHVKFFSEMVNKSINNIPITPQDVKTLLSIPMGSAWMESHPNFLESVPEAKDLFSGIAPETIKQQNDISQNWMATNWSGICDELTKISNPTLIVSGTHDNNVPTANSLVIAGKIPGAWLIQIKDAGHALFAQYPDKVNRVLQTFLSTTITSPS
ncbi:MAG: alpha/beta hydrolase [Thermoproteota archaeon]|nr:alpha/beta hydrolase [Thermoproteota archaeon]